MKIYKGQPERFTNDTFDMQIDMFSPLRLVDTPKFMATGMVAVPNGRPMQIPFEIEAETIEEAFENFESGLREEINRLEAEDLEMQKQQSIITPNSGIII